MTRCNKAAAGRRTPKVLLLALLLICTSCTQKPATLPQTAASSPSPNASASPFPQRVGLVNDFANAFNPSQEKTLDSMLTQMKSDVDVEFVVVTIDSTNGQPLFDYSLGLARQWAPGGDSGRGLVLTLAIKDREWRLQVSKELEKDLPDDVCLSLAEPAENLYRQEKYAEGVQAYVRAISDRLKAKH
ncbi:MAG TPA: TPM domain-containing protein [Pyrinomonadaceae bacterium]|nr:TPM domain-containing protein [Pyrinomonadaceae bacterium]